MAPLRRYGLHPGDESEDEAQGEDDPQMEHLAGSLEGLALNRPAAPAYRLFR